MACKTKSKLNYLDTKIEYVCSDTINCRFYCKNTN